MAPSYEKYDAVVCGAGIAGIAGAYALTHSGLKRVLIVDPGPFIGSRGVGARKNNLVKICIKADIEFTFAHCSL